MLFSTIVYRPKKKTTKKQKHRGATEGQENTSMASIYMKQNIQKAKTTDDIHINKGNSQF